MWSAKISLVFSNDAPPPLFLSLFFLLLAWKCCPGRVWGGWLSAQDFWLSGALVWTGNPRQSPTAPVQINSIAHALWAWNVLSLTEVLRMCCKVVLAWTGVSDGLFNTRGSLHALKLCAQHMCSRSSFSPGSCPKQCVWIENCKQKYNVPSNVYFL